MTLQRRVLLLILLSAPLVWAAALLFSLDRARGEINELFDTELVRLARQMQSTLPLAALEAIELPTPSPAAAGASTATDQGHAEIEDMAVAVWNREGKLLLVDREGTLLPHDPQGSGFHDMKLGGAAWRVFYLQSASGDWLVAAGQALAERDELVWDLITSQLLPWVLTQLQRLHAHAIEQVSQFLGQGADDPLDTLLVQVAGKLQDQRAAMPGAPRRQMADLDDAGTRRQQPAAVLCDQLIDLRVEVTLEEQGFCGAAVAGRRQQFTIGAAAGHQLRHEGRHLGVLTLGIDAADEALDGGPQPRMRRMKVEPVRRRPGLGQARTEGGHGGKRHRALHGWTPVSDGVMLHCGA